MAVRKRCTSAWYRPGVTADPRKTIPVPSHAGWLIGMPTFKSLPLTRGVDAFVGDRGNCGVAGSGSWAGRVDGAGSDVCVVPGAGDPLPG
jgi:hypothetical protein